MIKLGKWEMLLFLCLSFAPSFGHAAPLSELVSSLPDVLKPWVPWVIDEQTQDCLQSPKDSVQTICTLPVAMSFDVTPQSITFTQKVLVLSKSAMVRVPGSKTDLPRWMTLDGKDTPLVVRDGLGYVFLPKGTHELKGLIEPTNPLKELSIPEDILVVSLSVNGETMPFPLIAPPGQLQLSHKHQDEVAAAEDDAYELSVHRLYMEKIPSLLESRISIKASGKERAITLMEPLPKGFIPLHMESENLVRLDESGRLVIIAKRGTSEVKVTAYAKDPFLGVKVPDNGIPEYWSYQWDNRLRTVQVQGGQQIDARQTTIPKAWHQFHSVVFNPSDEMAFVVQHALGQSEHSPKLTLKRTMVLDFFAPGVTFEDQISGSFDKATRLNMRMPFEMGKASQNKEDLLITLDPKTAESGVELLSASQSLEVQSRISERQAKIPANGYSETLQAIETTLKLPPGYRLLHASGADQVDGTILERYNLMRIFLILMTTLAVFRLSGLLGAVIAFLCLLLTITEIDAPQELWIIFCVFLAISEFAKNFPKLAATFKTLAVVTLIGLSVEVFYFALNQARIGLYAVLELDMPLDGDDQPYGSLRATGDVKDTMVSASAPMPMAESPVNALDDSAGDQEDEGTQVKAKKMEQAMQEQQVVQRMLSKADTGYMGMGVAPHNYQKINKRQSANKNVSVQTGHGIPKWQWYTSSLQWTSPVPPDQLVHLYLVPPWLNRGLAFARVFLVIALFLVLIKKIFGTGFGPIKSQTQAGLVCFLLTGLMLFGSKPAQADIPSSEMLEQLKQRVNAPPLCFPDCVSLHQLRLNLKERDHISMTLQVHGAGDSLMPLPLDPSDLAIASLIDDKGRAVPTSVIDGQIYALTEPRIYPLTLKAIPKQSDQIRIPITKQPAHFSMDGDAWDVVGILPDGSLGQSLVLSERKTASNKKAEEQKSQNRLRPFIEIVRHIHIGFDIEIETTIKRLDGGDDTFVLRYALLPQEQMLTDGVTVENGMISLPTYPHGNGAITLNSRLPSVDKITLVAKTNLVKEVWQITKDPQWHIAQEGIWPTEYAQDAVMWRYEPWENESLSLSISKPEVAKGPHLTFEAVSLTIDPGVRQTRSELKLVYTSSLGGEHTIALPKDAKIMHIKHDGLDYPNREATHEVKLSLSPGKHEINLVFTEDKPLGWLFTTPTIHLRSAFTNSRVVVNLPPRWPLFVWGDTHGPCILFWGKMIIILLFALILGQFTWAPLSALSWFLLLLGVSQVELFDRLIIVLFFFAVAMRERFAQMQSSIWFNFRQIALLIWGICTCLSVYEVIVQGFWGPPQMGLAGLNASWQKLSWYLDRGQDQLPLGSLVSWPMLAYKGVMLLWALWFALAILKWAPWMFKAITAEGVFRPWRKPKI